MRQRKVAVLLMFVLVLSSCAWLQKQGVKDFSTMTPKERSTFFMGVYVGQYNATMALAQKPDITDDERKIVRVKKAILLKMYPAIMAYDSVTVAGGVPSADSEAALNDLINQLITAGVK